MKNAESEPNNEPKVILEPIVERENPVVGTSSLANPVSYPSLDEKVFDKNVLVEEEPEDVYASLADSLEKQKAQSAESLPKPAEAAEQVKEPTAAVAEAVPPSNTPPTAPPTAPQASTQAPASPTPEKPAKEASEPKVPTAEEIDQILRESETKDDKFLPRKTGQRIARLREITQHLSNRIKELESVRNDEKKAFDELKKKLEVLEASKPPSEESLAKQMERLAMLERRFEIESSEDVKKMFDTPLEELRNEVSKILEAANIAKDSEVAEEFMKRGPSGVARDYPEVFEGVLALLESGSRPHGVEATAQTRLLARKLESLTVQDDKIRSDRAKWIETQSKAADEYFKKEREKSDQLAKNAQKLIDEKIKEREAAYSSLLSHELFAQPKEATPERVTAHERAKQIAKIAIEADDSQTRAQVALLAAAAELKNMELKAAQSRIADLESQLSKLKSANRTVPSTSSLDKLPEKQKSPFDFSTPEGYTDWSAFARYLETNKSNLNY